MIRNNCSSIKFIFCLVILCLNCGLQTTGVETTNGATVVVCKDNVEGTAPPFANVFLFNAGYIPYIDTGLGLATISNAEGYYTFNDVKLESLSVTVINNDNSRYALLSAGCQDSSSRANLQIPGSMQGSVSSSEAGLILVFLYGTGYYTLVKDSGSFVLNNLPVGKYKIQAIRIFEKEFPAKPIMVASSEIMDIVIEPERKTTIPALKVP